MTTPEPGSAQDLGGSAERVFDSLQAEITSGNLTASQRQVLVDACGLILAITRGITQMASTTDQLLAITRGGTPVQWAALLRTCCDDATRAEIARLIIGT